MLKSRLFTGCLLVAGFNLSAYIPGQRAVIQDLTRAISEGKISEAEARKKAVSFKISDKDLNDEIVSKLIITADREGIQDIANPAMVNTITSSPSKSVEKPAPIQVKDKYKKQIESLISTTNDMILQLERQISSPDVSPQNEKLLNKSRDEIINQANALETKIKRDTAYTLNEEETKLDTEFGARYTRFLTLSERAREAIAERRAATTQPVVTKPAPAPQPQPTIDKAELQKLEQAFRDNKAEFEAILAEIQKFREFPSNVTDQVVDDINDKIRKAFKNNTSALSKLETAEKSKQYEAKDIAAIKTLNEELEKLAGQLKKEQNYLTGMLQINLRNQAEKPAAAKVTEVYQEDQELVKRQKAWAPLKKEADDLIKSFEALAKKTITIPEWTNADKNYTAWANRRENFKSKYYLGPVTMDEPKVDIFKTSASLAAAWEELRQTYEAQTKKPTTTAATPPSVTTTVKPPVKGTYEAELTTIIGHDKLYIKVLEDMITGTSPIDATMLRDDVFQRSINTPTMEFNQKHGANITFNEREKELIKEHMANAAKALKLREQAEELVKKQKAAAQPAAIPTDVQALINDYKNRKFSPEDLSKIMDNTREGDVFKTTLQQDRDAFNQKSADQIKKDMDRAATGLAEWTDKRIAFAYAQLMSTKGFINKYSKPGLSEADAEDALQKLLSKDTNTTKYSKSGGERLMSTPGEKTYFVKILDKNKDILLNPEKIQILSGATGFRGQPTTQPASVPKTETAIEKDLTKQMQKQNEFTTFLKELDKKSEITYDEWQKVGTYDANTRESYAQDVAPLYGKTLSPAEKTLFENTVATYKDLVNLRGQVNKKYNAPKPTTPSTTKPAATTSSKVPADLQQLASKINDPVKAETEDLKKVFAQPAGFGGLQGKTITLYYLHIFGLDFSKSTDTEIVLNGFHHDYERKVQKEGTIRYGYIRVNHVNCYSTPLLYDFFNPAQLKYQEKDLGTKNFFPSDWPRVKVVEKIREAYDDAAKRSNIQDSDDKKAFVIRGKTSEGIEIKMLVSKDGLIFTAFPENL